MRGFGEAASERWEEAIPYIERFLNYNPKSTFGYLALSILYAQVGRLQEARKTLEKGTEGWPVTMKNLRYVMSVWPLKDPKILECFAEGFLKAGLPGEPFGYYKITEGNQLTGDEIREQLFGHQVTGFTMGSGKQWWIQRSQDGASTIRDGEEADIGKSWTEEDMLCDQWDNLYEGLKDCWVVYRNLEGTPGEKDEYLGAPGYGIYPFSLVE